MMSENIACAVKTDFAIAAIKSRFEYENNFKAVLQDDRNGVHYQSSRPCKLIYKNFLFFYMTI